MTKGKVIRVVYKEPGKVSEEKCIPNELAELQRLVGGYIETVTIPATPDCRREKDIVIICDEEGKLHQAEPNFICAAINDMICGPAVIVGLDESGEDFGDIMPEDALAVRGILDYEPENKALIRYF